MPGYIRDVLPDLQSDWIPENLHNSCRAFDLISPLPRARANGLLPARRLAPREGVARQSLRAI